MQVLEFLLSLAGYLEAISNLALIYIVASYFYGRRWITVKLSCGDIKIRQCDLNASNLTNAVSHRFYNGGQIPSEVRSEIIHKTLPKIK